MAQAPNQAPAGDGGWQHWPFTYLNPAAAPNPPPPNGANGGGGVPLPIGVGGAPDGLHEAPPIDPLAANAHLNPEPPPPLPPAAPQEWYVSAWNAVTDFFSGAWNTVCAWWTALVECFTRPHQP